MRHVQDILRAYHFLIFLVGCFGTYELLVVLDIL